MITQIDFYILDSMQNLRCGFLDFIMPFITYLGSGGAIWIAAALIMLSMKKTRKTGVAVGIALLAGYLLSTVLLKGVIGRERPFNTAGAMIDENSLLIGIPSGRFSFPSGHALSSFSAAFVIFHYNKKYGAAALITASFIAFSRLYLYVHFPSDIVGGIIMGFGFAAGAIFISEKIWEKINERKLSDSSG